MRLNRAMALLVLAVVAVGLAFAGSVLIVMSQNPSEVAGQLVVYGP